MNEYKYIIEAAKRSLASGLHCLNQEEYDLVSRLFHVEGQSVTELIEAVSYDLSKLNSCLKFVNELFAEDLEVEENE